MGLLDIFRPGERPAPHHRDDVLGPMDWSADDEAWSGTAGGVRYLLAYDGRVGWPTDDLIAYARAWLVAPGGLPEAVERAKAAEAAAHPGLAEELVGLRVGSACFHTHKGARQVLVELAGGREDRAWRAEFRERECEGIGFDS